MITAIYEDRKRKTCCACTERRICTRIRVTWSANNTWNPFEHSSDKEWICDYCLKEHKADGRVVLK